MLNSSVYRETKVWKRPLHASKTRIAKSYLKLLPNLEVIGITGSVGKTLTQNAISSVLSQKYRTVVGDENLDPTFRIPQTILATRPWHRKLILEYGVERPGDMDHYLSIVKPKIGVVTAITPTHIKYFRDVDGVYREKVKLVKALDKNCHAVLNADDPYCVKMAEETSAKVNFYGKKAKRAVKISHYAQTLNGSKFRLHFQGQKATVSTRIVGEHQLASFYAAAAVGIICGLTLKQIAKGLSAVKPPQHRMNVIVNKKLAILDDTYNSSPKAAIEAVNALTALGKRITKVAILGEMKDLGMLSTEAHHALGQKIAKTGINFLVTIGPIATTIADRAKKSNFPGKMIKASNTSEAIGIAKMLIGGKKCLVLVKGSRHSHLERVVYGLLGKSTEINCYHCGVLA